MRITSWKKGLEAYSNYTARIQQSSYLILIMRSQLICTSMILYTDMQLGVWKFMNGIKNCRLEREHIMKLHKYDPLRYLGKVEG